MDGWGASEDSFASLALSDVKGYGEAGMVTEQVVLGDVIDFLGEGDE